MSRVLEKFTALPSHLGIDRSLPTECLSLRETRKSMNRKMR